MRANISITDGVYGVLSSMDVKGEITELGKKIISNESGEVGELKSLVKLLLHRLEESNIN